MRTHDPCRGSAVVGAVFWAFGIALFVLPFLSPRDTTNWLASDPGRKTKYYSDDEDAEETLDFPFLDDVAYLARVAAEDEWELEGTIDELVSSASRERLGRDYRGYFAVDHDAYTAQFKGHGDGATWAGPLSPAPIDLEAARATGLFEVERLVPGEREYRRLCAGCHGLAGDGSGPSSRYLDPRPRNFRKGIFKFTSTGWDSRARREDLFRTITDGLVGSAMPEFRLLPEEKRWDVVEYVRFLAIQGEFEQTLVREALGFEEWPDPDETFARIAGWWGDAKQAFPGGEEPANDADSIARGRGVYQSLTAACTSCHGPQGRGDGPSANEFLDAWGYPIFPRDLTTGQLRVGTGSADLYVLLAHGIKGTPMPGQAGALTDQELWDLVHFVQSFATGERR